MELTREMKMPFFVTADCWGWKKKRKTAPWWRLTGCDKVECKGAVYIRFLIFQELCEEKLPETFLFPPLFFCHLNTQTWLKCLSYLSVVDEITLNSTRYWTSSLNDGSTATAAVDISKTALDELFIISIIFCVQFIYFCFDCA